MPPRDRKFYLLQAHRQPLAENVAAEFIRQFTQPNELVVDPFVGSDAVVHAALSLGRRIVAADSNPLVAWAARIEATLPNARDINAALSRLGDTRRRRNAVRDDRKVVRKCLRGMRRRNKCGLFRNQAACRGQASACGKDLYIREMRDTTPDATEADRRPRGRRGTARAALSRSRAAPVGGRRGERAAL